MAAATGTPQASGCREFPDRTATVPHKNRPFYLHQVDRFLNGLEKQDLSDPAITDDSVKAYLDNLSREKENWQVHQASEALRLYRHYQSTLRPAPNTSASAAHAALWDAARKQLVEIIRLKHLSIATEQARAYDFIS